MTQFSETKTGQFLIHGKKRAKDRGLKVVILMYGIIRDNPKKTLLWVTVIGAFFYVIFGQLDVLIELKGKLEKLLPGIGG